MAETMLKTVIATVTGVEHTRAPGKKRKYRGPRTVLHVDANGYGDYYIHINRKEQRITRGMLVTLELEGLKPAGDARPVLYVRKARWIDEDKTIHTIKVRPHQNPEGDPDRKT